MQATVQQHLDRLSSELGTDQVGLTPAIVVAQDCKDAVFSVELPEDRREFANRFLIGANIVAREQNQVGTQRVGLIHRVFDQFPRGERKEVVVGHQRDSKPVQGRTEVG